MNSFFRFLNNGGEWLSWPILAAAPYIFAMWTGHLTTLGEVGIATIVSVVVLGVALVARRRHLKRTKTTPR